MPGSIRVSVMEAFDLSDTVSDGKDLAIKVSIGKMEYKTEPSKAIGGKTMPWNSTFEFPVLNLRDSLSVILIGDDEEAISKNEIDTPSIVERGSFALDLVLKGGGKIHLRLSFVLTDEERRRIDMMRAAALKRKEQAALKSSAASVPQAEIGSVGVQDSSLKDVKNGLHHVEGSGPQETNQGSSVSEELDVLKKSLDRSVQERRQGSLPSKEAGTLEKSLDRLVEERREMAINNEEQSQEPARIITGPDGVDGEDATPSGVKARIKAFEKTRPMGAIVQLSSASGKMQRSSPHGRVSSSTKRAKTFADKEAESFGDLPSCASHMVETERTHAIPVDAQLPVKDWECPREVTTRGQEHGLPVLEEKSPLGVASNPLVSMAPPETVNNIGIPDGDKRAVTEQPYDVECIATSMKEKKNANPFGISQQVLGGVAMVATGVLLWATHSWASHSYKRSSYLKRLKQRKRK